MAEILFNFGIGLAAAIAYGVAVWAMVKMRPWD